jgi:hypothetical protein
MKKVKPSGIIWLFLYILTVVSVVYYFETHSIKSQLFASGSAFLLLLLHIREALVTKRTSVGITKYVEKNKDPKAFRGHLVAYTILLLLMLVFFVHGSIALIK